MKQEKHIDLDAMLRNLPQDADKALNGLQATPFLKARIDRAVAEKKQGKVRFTMPKWAPAVCCAAVVLILALTVMPLGMNEQPGNLIQSGPMGPATATPASQMTADLGRDSLFISTSNAKPGYRSIWSDVKDGSFPLIGVNGKYYRMLTSPNSVDSDLLGGAIATVSEFTTEPSLSGTDVVLSNAATSGSPVYAVRGVDEDTLVAAEVNGRVRLFQRVSFNGNALRGKEKLADTLAISGQVIAMELTGVGTVTDPAACETLLATLLSNASYESRGSISSRQALLIELQNGLVLQLSVKGDNLAGCGVWSLIASQLAQKLVLMLVLTATIRWFPHAEFSFARLGQLFGYSWKLFVGWLIGTVHQDIYAFIIGKYFSTATLGYYNRASNLPQTVTKTVNETVSNVMFPALAKLQDEPDAFKQNTRRMMSLICFLIWPITAGIAAVSESFIMVVLTEKWAASIPMMQLFALAYGFNVISTANMQSFNALGRSDVFMKLEMVKRSLSVALLLVAAILVQNIFAVIGVITLMGLFSICYNAFVNRRLLGYTLREQLADMAPSFGISALMFAAVYAVSLLPISYTVMLILQILLGVDLYFGLAAAFRLPAMKIATGLVKSFLKRR